MHTSEKLRQLRDLKENQLRREIIIPLLGRMGFLAVEEFHGSGEKGKDIVCHYLDKLNLPRYMAVVAKTDDLNGNIASDNSLKRVLAQVEQCFDERIVDPATNRAAQISEVWVITSGRVIPTAWESVQGKLEKGYLDRLLRIISGERLVDLVDRHFADHWNLREQTLANAQSQRDQLLEFLRQLLRGMKISMDQERTVLDQLLYSTRIPSVESLQTSSRIFSASAYSVTLADETEEQWPKGLVSRSYGSIEKSFQKARQAIKRGLYDMDEVARKAEQALAAERPIEFVRHCDRNFIEDFSDYRSVRLEIDEIRQSVLEAEELLTSLDAIGQRDRYLNLVRSLNSLEREVADYIAQQTGRVIVLNWQIEETTSPRVVCLYDRAPSPEAKGFKTEDSVEYSFYHGGHPMFPRERPIEASDVLVSAQYELLAIFDKLLPSEPEL